MERPGETQKKLAEYVGVSQPAVGKWLNEKIPTLPGSEELWKLARYFGVQMETLFPGETHLPSDPRCDNLDEMKEMREAIEGIKEDVKGMRHLVEMTERRIKKFS